MSCAATDSKRLPVPVYLYEDKLIVFTQVRTWRVPRRWQSSWNVSRRSTLSCTLKARSTRSCRAEAS